MADCRMIPRLLDHLCLKSKLCVLTRGLERERHPQLSSCRTFPGLHPDRYVSTMPAQKLNYLRPPRQTWDDTFSGYSQTAGGHGESGKTSTVSSTPWAARQLFGREPPCRTP